MSLSVALKLGSCNTSIYKLGEGLVLFEPSMVACLSGLGEKTVVAVGKNAKRMQGRTEDSVAVCSPIFEGRIKDRDIAITMLKSFISAVVPNSLIKPKIKAVVCLPMGMTLKERKEVEFICNHAGIQDVVFVPAVIAGAVGYNLPIEDAVGTCVVNIGGGSTDIATISAGSIISGINIGIGGNLMDEAISKEIESTHGIKIGEGVATEVKEEIGSLYQNDISSVEVVGIDTETADGRFVVVESSTIYKAIEPLYEKITEAIKAVILSSPANIVEDIKNRGIYVMGGASLTTGLEQYLRKMLNIPVQILDQTTAVDVIGAGMMLQDAKLLKLCSKL